MNQKQTVTGSAPVEAQAVLDVIRTFLDRANKGDVTLMPETELHGDASALNLDSLETAELSAILEDELGFDPFSVGLLPRTIGEILAFYAASGV